MTEFERGDRIRIDIPDADDPDFEFHGSHGTIKEVIRDNAGKLTGRKADSIIYRVSSNREKRTIFEDETYVRRFTTGKSQGEITNPKGTRYSSYQQRGSIQGPSRADSGRPSGILFPTK